MCNDFFGKCSALYANCRLLTNNLSLLLIKGQYSNIFKNSTHSSIIIWSRCTFWSFRYRNIVDKHFVRNKTMNEWYKSYKSQILAWETILVNVQNYLSLNHKHQLVCHSLDNSILYVIRCEAMLLPDITWLIVSHMSSMDLLSDSLELYKSLYLDANWFAISCESETPSTEDGIVFRCFFLLLTYCINCLITLHHSVRKISTFDCLYTPLIQNLFLAAALSFENYIMK